MNPSCRSWFRDHCRFWWQRPVVEHTARPPERQGCETVASETTVDFADDGQLVEALRRRDETAFVWLLDRYNASLRRVATNFVRTGASADEVVQETWLAVLAGIDRFEMRSTVKTWVFRILMNVARTRGVREHRNVPFSDLAPERGEDAPSFAPDRFRSGLRLYRGHWDRGPEPWEEQPAERLEAAETLATVRGAIAQLPDRQRAVVTLRDIDGWTAAEVCDLLELSEANQRVLLHRGRARIRQAVEDAYGGRGS
jgi:RNA polymerase sigma-70 factor (ECF subfamily)